MEADLRSYIESIKGEKFKDFYVINKRAKTEFEIPSVLSLLEKQNRYPLILWTKVNNNYGNLSNYQVLVNLFADRRRIAKMLDCSQNEIPIEITNRVSSSTSVKFVEDAPIKENIFLDNEVDLMKLPILWHHERDAGAYITAGVVILKDPDTGIPNTAVQRLMLKGKNKLGLFMMPGRHNWIIYEKYRKINRNPEVAIVIGHHPAFYLGVQWVGKLAENEYEIAGGILGEPLQVTNCESLETLLIPARAEIVIEGEIPLNVLEKEAPFGEYTGYYGGERNSNIINVTAISHRNNPIYLDIYGGHRDNHILGGVLMESQVYQAVESRNPTIKDIYLPPSGCCRFLCYISIDKQTEGQPKNIISTVLGANELIKYVVVVDSDIDVYNEEEVLWAIATRSRINKDMVVIKNAMGSVLDPSSNHGITDRGGIDATIPLDSEYPDRLSISKDILHETDLNDYDF